MKLTSLLLAGTAASLMTTTAMAQTALGTSAAEDQIEDLNEAIADDFARDREAFGNQGRRQVSPATSHFLQQQHLATATRHPSGLAQIWAITMARTATNCS